MQRFSTTLRKKKELIRRTIYTLIETAVSNFIDKGKNTNKVYDEEKFEAAIDEIKKIVMFELNRRLKDRNFGN